MNQYRLVAQIPPSIRSYDVQASNIQTAVARLMAHVSPLEHALSIHCRLTARDVEDVWPRGRELRALDPQPECHHVPQFSR